MKKVIPIKCYYIFFFLVNIINSILLIKGVFNPNISSYRFSPLALLGDLGVIGLSFILTLIFIKKDKYRILTLNIISTIFFLLILFLQIYSNIFSLFFSYSHLISFNNPTQLDLILGYFNYILGMFLNLNILIPLLLYLSLIIISFFIKKEDKSFNKKIISLSSSIISILFPILICNININNTFNEINMNSFYGVSNMGVYNYYLYSLKDLFNNDKRINDEGLDIYLNEHLYQKDNTLNVDDKNLIIIQLEAINDFVIDLKINDEEITPFLSNLKNEGYYCSSFLSVAGIGNTSDAEFSSLVGLYPNGNDLSIFKLKGENYPSLAKEFNEIGYKTLSIHGNDGEFYDRNNIHLELFGFDEHIDKKDLLNRNKDLSLINNWISDEDLLKESVNIYKEINSNFFSYNILVSSHAPYKIDKGIEKYNNKDLTSLANNYISYVKYVDKAIESFIEELKKNNLFDNNIIVLYGDHTSSLLRKDLESITKKDYSNVEFRKEMMNVPFIMIGEDIPKMVDKRVHSNVDILPTMANLFNLTPTYSFGVNMFSDKSNYVYSPRTLDIFYDDVIIESTSKKVTYINSNKVLDNNEIIEKINLFKKDKYYNDLILHSNYFC